MKKLVSVLAALALFGYAGIAFASAPATYHLNITPDSGPDYVGDIATPTLDGTTVNLFGLDSTTGAPITYHLNQGFYNSGGQLDVILPITGVVGLNDYLNDYNGVKFPFLYTAMANATSSLNTAISMLGVLQGVVNGLPAALNIPSFMGNNASTTPFIASSTQNGFMSLADKVKLDSMGAWVASTTSRSLVTGTGATGFLVSSSRNTTVHYNVRVTTTASIAGNAEGYVALEVSPTNSATSTDWVEDGRCGNSQTLSLAITLQSVQGTTCQLSTDLPAGYYAKLRSVTTTGTVSFGYVSGREVLK